MTKRILLVSDDTRDIDLFKTMLISDGYEVKTALTIDDGVAAYYDFTPDVTVLDLFMAGGGGREMLTKLTDKKGKMLVMTGVKNERLFEQLFSEGADDILIKPFTLSALSARVRQSLTSSVAASKKAQLERRLSEVFLTVGIPAHIKGYQFLKEAIKRTIYQPDIINSITKRLYPEVAQTFCTSPSKVERAIRHAIEVAWNRGKIDGINSLFGLKVYAAGEKPTNGEFIALVADKLMLESV